MKFEAAAARLRAGMARANTGAAARLHARWRRMRGVRLSRDHDAGGPGSERDVERDGTGITDGLFFTPRLDLGVLDEGVRDLLHAVDRRHERHLEPPADDQS